MKYSKFLSNTGDIIVSNWENQLYWPLLIHPALDWSGLDFNWLEVRQQILGRFGISQFFDYFKRKVQDYIVFFRSFFQEDNFYWHKYNFEFNRSLTFNNWKQISTTMMSIVIILVYDDNSHIPNIHTIKSDTHTFFLSILIQYTGFFVLDSQCAGVPNEVIDIWYMGFTCWISLMIMNRFVTTVWVHHHMITPYECITKQCNTSDECLLFE